MKKLCSAVALIMLGAMTMPVAAREYQVAHFASQATSYGAYETFFAKQMAERTDGAVKLRIFWAGALGTGNEIIPLVAGAAVPMGVTAPSYYPSEMPISGMLNALPTSFKSVAEVMRAQRTLSETDPNYIAEYERLGIYPIVHHGLSTLRLICTRPVRGIADLKGLKVRSWGYFLPLALSEFGSIAVTVPLQDQYEALSRGVIDCTPTGYDVAYAYKLHEVAKYWVDINLGAFSGPTLYVNRNIYLNDWSEKTRGIVRELADEIFADEQQKLDRLDDEAVAKARAAGVELIAFPDQAEFDSRVPDMIQAWQDKQVADGMDPAVAAAVANAVRAERKE